jgi:hypothetical protein
MTVLVPGFRPESALERRLVRDPKLRAGLAWGHPRAGHPEGSVGRHAASMLRRIPSSHPRRRDLRLLALLHDAFKYRIDPTRRYAPDNDHAVLARRFAEHYISDPTILATLELHDEPYWQWRTGAHDEALQRLLASVPDQSLFTAFVELDASAPGKDPAFLRWFRARAYSEDQTAAA